MATITNLEDALMSSRSKVGKWTEEYQRKFTAPKRKQALGALWLRMGQAERERLARERPDIYHEIMTLTRKKGG